MNSRKLKTLLTSFALTGAFLSTGTSQAQDVKIGKDGYQLKIKKQVEVTSVKNQGKTGTCWSFSTTSFIESEAMRMGKASLDLSEMYFVRYNYPAKAEKFMRMQGHSNFGEGSLAHDVLHAVQQYGIVPEQHYSGLSKGEIVHDHRELFAVLDNMLKTLMKSNPISDKWEGAFTAVLDAYLGKTPDAFDFEGKEYTPQSFAKDVVGFDPENYIELTSFNHHPYYSSFQLEVPDNWAGASFYNLPLDEFEKVMEHALEEGFSFVWDGDVSEKTFSHKDGIAIVPKVAWEQKSKEEKESLFSKYEKELEIDENVRQHAFDNQTTTDDHLMHIIGSVTDQHGVKYYVTKNSWGNSNDFGGYLYMSQSYMRLKTVSIMLHKDAIPEDIKQKINI